MIEQIDKIIRYGLTILALIIVTINAFKQLQQKYIDYSNIRLFITAAVVVLFVILPPMLVSLFIVMLPLDPENLPEALLLFALPVICFIVTYRIAHRYFLH